MTILIVSIIVYTLGLLLTAVLCRGSVRTQNEFCIGARKLRSSEIGFSGQISELGCFFLVLIPSAVYTNGTGSAWIVVSLFTGTVFGWYLMSYRLMRYSLKFKNIYSLPAYYGRRFGRRSRSTVLISSIFSIFFDISIIVVLVRMLGILMVDIFDIDIKIVMACIVAAASGFVMLGGFFGTGKMNYIHVIILFVCFGTIFTVIWNVFKADELIVAVMNSRVTGGVSKYLNLIYLKGKSITVAEVMNQISWGLVIMGLPGLLTKFITLDKARTAKHGGRNAFIFTLTALFFSVVAGVVLRAFIYPAILRKNNIFLLIPRTVKKLNEMEMFYRVSGGILLIGLIAVFMSMIISRMVNLCTVVYCEICKNLLFKKKRIKKNMKALRITMAVLTLCILVLCLIKVEPFEYIKLLLMLSAIFFGPVTFMSLYFKRMNRFGAVAGMLSGTFTALFWHFVRCINGKDGFMTIEDYLEINPVYAAYLVSLIFIVLVSISTEKVEESVKKDFDEVKNRIIT
ncbi:MAG: hypothetical protein K6C35_05435 [Eubacterium sp.]|nr:hypothetical protein [Eubacterium sp.]